MIGRWLAAVAVLLLAVGLLLWDRTPRATERHVVVRTIATMSAARRLFGDGLDDPAIMNVDADAEPGLPVLVGVVGRLPDAAVALVQGADGRSRTVAIGGAAGDWRLEGLAADQAVFANGARLVRVRMAAPDQE